jgi:hypothetical protein
MKRNLILASVVGLTLAGFAPAAFAQQNRDNVNERYELRQDNRVPYAQVPGDVKRAIEPQLNQGDKVTEAYKYKRGDRTVYVAYTNDERIIRADDRGNLISVRSTEDEAEPNRKFLRFRDLPAEVKRSLREEAKGNPMEVYEISRDDKKFFVANIEDDQGTRRVRVNAEGKLIGEPVLLSDRDDRDNIDARRRQDRARYQGERTSISEVPGHIKSTLLSEAGQDKVTDVMKVNRNGKTVYRADIESETRAKTVWVDEDGKLLREMNDTEEGRQRVDMSDLPGHVKSALINEAHGKEPTRIWQVTRGRETWYVGEANDGHLVRIDSQGKVMSHDSHPNLLSNRADNRDNARSTPRENNARETVRDNRENNPRDNRDNDRNPNRKIEKPRDLDRDNDGKIDGDPVNFARLPDEVKQTVRDNTKNGENISGIYRVKRDNDSVHYIVETDDGRYIRIGEKGGLLGQTR